MSCDRIDQHLTDYLDGTLEGAERASLDAHMEGCAECRRNLEEVRWVTEMLHQVPREEPPADLASRIHLALAALPDEQDEPEPAPVREPALATITPISAARSAPSEKTVWWKRFSVPSAVVGAAAAAFVIALVNVQPNNLPRVETAAVSMQTDVAVNIGFDVGEDVDGVTFQVDLPEGLQFVGEDTQPLLAQSVSWKGALKEGKTVIPIVVRGVRPGKYEILATVRKGAMKRQTTIVLPVQES